MERRWPIVRRELRELGRGLLDLLLAPTCAACEDEADPLCGRCRQALVVRRDPACPRCGERSPAGGGCGAEHRELSGVAWHAAPFAYRGTGGALVRRFKLDANAAAGRFLARAMADALRSHLVDGWRRPRLVPVPLHAARARQRGFDQAQWLAEGLAKRLGLGPPQAALVRVAPTLPQGDPRGLSRDRRELRLWV